MPLPVADSEPDVLVLGLGDIGRGVVAARAGQARVRGYDIDAQARRKAAEAFGTANVPILGLADQGVQPLVSPGEIVIDCTRGVDTGAFRALLEGRQAWALAHFSSFIGTAGKTDRACQTARIHQ